jgi:hypothetical protein
MWDRFFTEGLRRHGIVIGSHFVGIGVFVFVAGYLRFGDDSLLTWSAIFMIIVLQICIHKAATRMQKHFLSAVPELHEHENDFKE